MTFFPSSTNAGMQRLLLGRGAPTFSSSSSTSSWSWTSTSKRATSSLITRMASSTKYSLPCSDVSSQPLPSLIQTMKQHHHYRLPFQLQHQQRWFHLSLLPSPTTMTRTSTMVQTGSSASNTAAITTNNPSFLQTTMRFKQGMKTNSGVKKRFRIRGSGSIKRTKSGRSHNTGYKTRQRVNRLGSSTSIEGTKMEQRVRKLLSCYGDK